jgi:hypothetical protein
LRISVNLGLRIIRETMDILLGTMVDMVGTNRDGRMIVVTNTFLATMVLACNHGLVRIDADLLQKTVQAVVAAVTAATKVTESTQGAPPTTALTGGTGQHAMTSVATSNAAPQATHEIQDNQGTGAKARDNEGQGP